MAVEEQAENHDETDSPPDTDIAVVLSARPKSRHDPRSSQPIKSGTIQHFPTITCQ